MDEAQGTRRIYRVDPAGPGEGPRVRAARTRVELEHRNLDRHGDGWQGLGEGVSGGHGWPLYLQRFAVAVAAT